MTDVADISRIPEADLNTHWVITRRRGKTTERTLVSVGAAGLRAFFHACDTGKPGTYHLHGNAARKTHELARAKVQADEMAITWHPEWVLFSLGAKGLAEEVPAVIAALREEGAWKKEGES